MVADDRVDSHVKHDITIGVDGLVRGMHDGDLGISIMCSGVRKSLDTSKGAGTVEGAMIVEIPREGEKRWSRRETGEGGVEL